MRCLRVRVGIDVRFRCGGRFFGKRRRAAAHRRRIAVSCDGLRGRGVPWLRERSRPDGVHEMVCPELTCALVECHAWETLVGGGYRSASDASLNLWVLGPVVFFGGLVLLLKRMG